MTVLIDQAIWPAHNTVWAHLVSDSSLEELHDFAESQGIPRRGFDRDHYDVPLARWQQLVDAGAVPVSVRELVQRLKASGLRVNGRERRGLTDHDAHDSTTANATPSQNPEEHL